MKVELSVEGNIPYLRSDAVALPARASASSSSPHDVPSPPAVGDVGPDGAVDTGAGVGPLEDDPVGGEALQEPAEHRDLKIEALALTHLMLHVPKNPWRPACQRAKMQQKPHRKGAHLGPPPDVFGDQVTADHIVIVNDEAFGNNSERDSLVIMDRATRWVECYPLQSKSADEAYTSLRDFLVPSSELFFVHRQFARTN